MNGRARRSWIWAAAVVLTLSAIGCLGSGALVHEYAPYGLDSVPPYWVCATATPVPTSTKAPCDCVCEGSVGTDECVGEPGQCIGAGEHWRLACSPWPPTPHPSPTPFIMVGGPFRLHQRIWVPIRPTVAPEPALGGTPAPPARGTIGIMLTSWSDHAGHRFEFQVTNASASPVDIDLPSQVFVRCGNHRVIHAERDHYLERGVEYPSSRLEPGEVRDISVTIRYDEPCPRPVLGVLTSPYLSRVGSRGLDASAVAGADTAIYIDYGSQVPGACSATQQAPLGEPYPEADVPPPDPERHRYAYANAIGGTGAGHRSDMVPVMMPPCLGITRGFGCHAFPTGVSGGDRCPPGAPYWHTGVDYSCPLGSPVKTPMGGALVHSSGTGYGRLAKIILSERGQTVQMYFAHLSRFVQSDVCRKGGICHAGSRVGRTGSTGFSTGPHLHWEMRVNDVPVDPFQYYGGSALGPTPGARGAEAEEGTGVLAAVAAVAASPESTATPRPPNRHPLTLRVRDVRGSGMGGLHIELWDIDGERDVAACIVDSLGQCQLDLAAGVYRVRLSGQVDGRPVHSQGAVNLAAQESGKGEYAYGPLALWHDGPQSTVGLVLDEDGSGVLHPLIDADPTGGHPRPLDPLEDHSTPVATRGPRDRSANGFLPDDSAQRGPARRIVGFVLWAAVLGLLAFVYYVSRSVGRSASEGREEDRDHA